ncbi:MAG: helix-turn-helix domain-containing protein [Verrucomicrobia bacterium]|nr:helix-turn-helix domain-containing protein [Verrucomicrobiota bacterium]
MNGGKEFLRGSLYHRLEDVVGCKWSVSVLIAVRAGVNRPGALERHIRGISSKVLAERLRKLTQYGLLIRTAYPEVPPRTEYALTQTGHGLVKIIGQIHKLDQTHKQTKTPSARKR